MRTSFDICLDSTLSRFDCRRLAGLSSKDHSTVCYKPSGMKACEVSTRGPHLHFLVGCSWTLCIARSFFHSAKSLLIFLSMLGSLTLYRRLLHEHVFAPPHGFLQAYALQPVGTDAGNTVSRLPLIGHAVAGVMAGWTVSCIAAPVEHIKARLQIQYAAEKSKRLYKGPLDCAAKIVG